MSSEYGQESAVEPDPPGRLHRVRGRPPRRRGSDVVDRLLDATELLLKENHHPDLTERQIGEVAQVDARMIHYYFGNKDGLLFATIARYSDEISRNLAILHELDPSDPQIMRRIVTIVIHAYYAKPWIAQIGLSEFAKNSPVKQQYVHKYEAAGHGQKHLQRTFDRLVALGAFDKSVDTAHAALCLFSVVLSCQLLKITATPQDMLVEATNAQWIDFVADLFDRKLRCRG